MMSSTKKETIEITCLARSGGRSSGGHDKLTLVIKQPVTELAINRDYISRFNCNLNADKPSRGRNHSYRYQMKRLENELES